MSLAAVTSFLCYSAGFSNKDVEMHHKMNEIIMIMGNCGTFSDIS